MSQILSTHLLSTASLLLGCIFVLAGCGGGTGKPARERPNILLISIDTLRADHVSCYGYERATTPHIDRIASEGVRFERAIASSSWTLPSHVTMLTGLPVSMHGVCDDRLWNRHAADGTLYQVPIRGSYVSEALQDAGYRTAGFVSWKYLEEQFGFGPGFEVYERLGHNFYSHPVVGPEFQRLRAAGDVEGMKALAKEHPALFDDTLPTTPEVIDRGLSWLGELSAAGSSDPFFLFLHLFDVHDPYTPPAPFDKRFDPDYEGPIDGRRITTADSPLRGDMDPRDLEHMVALYDGEIAWVDSEIGRLMQALEEMGTLENTLVVITSDHGEEFFEHGHKTHRRQLYLESVQVPLIMRWPAGLTGGKVVAGNVGLVDLAPTLCAAGGTLPSVPMFGTDLLPIARGAQDNAVRSYHSELDVFDNGMTPERQFGWLRGEQHVIVRARGTGEWEGELFDLASNPWGLGAGTALSIHSDQAAPLRAELERMRAAVPRWRARMPARGVDLEALSQFDRDQLAAMGYTSSDDEAAGPGDALRVCFDGCVWPDHE